MAAPAAPGPGAALSGDERDKLRERLARLRREYSETVSRLRRARRAERARSRGRGAAAEGGGRERSPAGSRDSVYPSADKHETSQLQTHACSDLGPEEEAPVPPDCAPEFCSGQGSLWGSSQAGQDPPCWGLTGPAPAEEKPQASRRLMKLSRRAKALAPEEGGGACDVRLPGAGRRVNSEGAGVGALGSPPCRRSSRPAAGEGAPGAPRPALLQEGKGLTPPGAAPAAGPEVPEGSVPPGAPQLSPCAPRGSGDAWQPESPRATGTAADPEPAQPCPGHSPPATPGTSGHGGQEPLSVTERTASEGACEDQGELQRLLDFMSENEVLPADGSSTVAKESRRREGNLSGTGSLNPFPTDLALGDAEEPLENQEPELQPRLSHPGEARAADCTPGSCTVVEGLLFPVEYYVRTTRRMSRCQRKVDLDAVILSQLGRSKKGQRSRCKQRDANSDRPTQERVEDDLESGVVPLPCLGAENDSANSSSPPKSLPASSGSSTSLGSTAQNGSTGTKRGQRRSRGKQKGRRNSACKLPGHQVSQELGESVDLLAPREGSSLLPSECQSEKENCEANLEGSPSDERRFSAAAALGSGEAEGAGTAQPEAADPPPGGALTPGRCRQALLGQAQDPLQGSSSADPGDGTSASHVADLEANLAACQAHRWPAELVEEHHEQGACGAERLRVPPRRPLRPARQRPRQPPADESKRGRSYPVGSEGPASLGLAAVEPDTCSSLFSFRSLQWLVPTLGIRDFHLPDEEFGLLKLEKLESSPVSDLEVFAPGVCEADVASEDTQLPQVNPEEKTLQSHLLLPFKTALPGLPNVGSPASRKELSTHELLLTPVGTVLAGAPTQPESQVSSSVFPVVGATPAAAPSVHSQLFPTSPSAPPSTESPRSSRAAPALAPGDEECKDSALPLPLGSCGAGSAREGEEHGAGFPVEPEGGPDSNSDEAVALEKHPQSESKQQRSCRASPEQKKDVAERLTPVLLDGLTEESLQLVSKLKDSSGSCAVDVSTMWWEAAGCRELCVVTACESSVSLWRPLASDRWEKVHTWQLGEVPVIQLVPLPDTCNLMCIALGDLEIGEIRLLLYSSENDSFKHVLIKTETIKAVLGLKGRRLVSSSRTLQEQRVEIVSLSETGRSKDGQTLMPPEETVLAFAEVEGERDALVGTTAAHSVLVWNLRTGQLLKKMDVGCSYPASVCHRAYSSSGLLFVVVSHPHAKGSASCGNPAFRLLAFNPRTARGAAVLSCCLPPARPARYLEGDVKDASAAAVLTSGTIAVWDLLLGHCTALLPPGPAGTWALARWATASPCLLAGQRDGTVCLYRYRQPRAGVA